MSSAKTSDKLFFVTMAGLGGLYVLLVVLLLAADVAFSSPRQFIDALRKPEIQYAVRLTLITCTISAVISVWLGTPLGYLLSRFRFPGRTIVDTIVDIPIVLPPMVLGLSLLILFHLPIGGTTENPGWRLEDWLRDDVGFPVTFEIPAVILAQVAVACAFAVRTMRVTFDQINPRVEDVGRTLGCSRWGAFLYLALPQAHRGIITSFTLAWARSLGEFGPIMIFAGSTRMRTEVLSTTVFLEWSVGNLEAAVAVSLLMVGMAMIVLTVLRLVGMELRA